MRRPLSHLELLQRQLASDTTFRQRDMDFFSRDMDFFFTPVVRRSADKGTWRAAARQGHSLMQRNNIRMLSLLEFEPQQTEQLHFRRLAKQHAACEKGSIRERRCLRGEAEHVWW